MLGYDVQQASASYPLVFLLVLSSDHISPATGLSPTVVISKNGAAFASPSGAVSEIGDGWYKVAGNATDTATLGPIILHATVATADPSDALYPCVAYNPQLAIPTAAQIATTTWEDTTAGGDFGTAGSIGKLIVTTGLTVSSVTGAVGSVTGAVGSVTGAVGSVTGNVGGNVVGSVGSVTGAVGSVTGLTTATIATAVWTDTTGGDLGTANSPGKILVTQLGGTFTTNASSIFTAPALANAPTGGGGGAPTAAQIATAVWEDTTAGGDFGTAGSIGKLLVTTGLTVSAVTGAVGSVTGNVGGNIAGSVASVTAPVSVNLAQPLNAARALDAIADTSLTLNDVFHCSVAIEAGKWAITGTSWVCQTPFSATTLRTFTLDSGVAPTMRS